MATFLSFLTILIPYKVIINGNGTINGWISFSFIAFIVFTAIFNFKKFNSKLDSTIKIVKEVNEYFLTFEKESVVDNYETINNILSNKPIIGMLWKEYDKSLSKVTGPDFDQEIYSAESANNFFNKETLIASQVNIDFYSALPGIYTGLGIFGTFLGLTVGLSGIDIASTEVDVIKEGIKNLLAGMGTAFSTSLWGLICALPTTYFMKKKLYAAYQEITVLQDRINNLFVIKTTESLLFDSVTELKKQSDELRLFNTDLAMSIGEALDASFKPTFDNLLKGITELTNTNATVAKSIGDSLDASLKPSFDNLFQAITELSNSGSSAIAKSLNESVGQELSSFGGILMELQTTLQETAKNSQDTVSKMNKVFEDTMNQTSEKIKDQLDQSLDKLLNVADQLESRAKSQNQNILQLTENLSQNIGDMINKYTAMTETTNEHFNTNISQINELITNSSKQIKESSELLDRFDSASKSVQECSVELQKNIKTFVDSNQSFFTNIQNATSRINDMVVMASRSVDTMKNSSEETRKDWEANRKQFENLKSDLEAIFDAIHNGLEGYRLTTSENMIKQLQDFNEGVTKAISLLNGGIEEFRGGIEDLSETLDVMRHAANS